MINFRNNPKRSYNLGLVLVGLSCPTSWPWATIKGAECYICRRSGRFTRSGVILSKYRVMLGADFIGYPLKEILKKELSTNPKVSELLDFGVLSADDKNDYPNIGFGVARAIASGKADRGLLVCGTGIGMAIAANKVKGIRATVAHDSYSLERAVLSNNCQIISFGARVIAPEVAIKLILPWLDYEFDQTGSSSFKVKLLSNLELKEDEEN